MTTAYQSIILADTPRMFAPCNESAYPLKDIVRNINNDAGFQSGTPGVSSTTPLGGAAWGNGGGSQLLAFDNPFVSGAAATSMSIEFWLSTTTSGLPDPTTLWPVTAGFIADSSSSAPDWGVALAGIPGGYMVPVLQIKTSVPNDYAIWNGSLVTAINDGNWHHIVGTWDGTTGTLRIYIDGAQVLSAVNALCTGGHTGNSLCWTGANASNWVGASNNLALYDYPLTATQVLTHYNGGLGASGTVPDVTLQTTAAATVTLSAAGFALGTQTTAYSGTVPVNEIISQAPTAGSTALLGSAVTVVVSLGPTPVLTIVPNLIGETTAAAIGTLGAANLVLGSTLAVYSPTVDAGLIMSQSPAAGTSVAEGIAVNVIVSKGAQASIVPNVIGLSAADANVAILAAGFIPATLQPIVTEAYAIGDVANQSPLGGVYAPAGTSVGISIAVFLLPFDVDTTVISQYANSPVILRLVENMAQYIDPRTNLENFYNFVWNVDTAVGFGLDYWGKIVGVSRLLKILGTDEYFGFENGSSGPFDWQNFGGAPFSAGALNTQAYLLPDDGYRVLILAKALANICATNARSLNNLLQTLFAGRGVVYVIDSGGMAMIYHFEFVLTPVEYAILTQSGAFPRPAGVSFTVEVP